MKLSDFSRYRVLPLPDGLEVTCTRCDTPQVFRAREFPADPDIAATDLIAWMQRHRCPAAGVPGLRRSRELVAV
jgi:hypothetical protein